jgi:biopolymer transport protein ExbD
MRDAVSETPTHTQPASNVTPGINVTPLIDILLVLLIIFMVITPLRPARFRTLVPEPSDGIEGKKSPRTLVVEIDRDLRLRLIRGETTVAEGSVADAAPVAARLAAEWRERKTNRQWKPEMDARADLPPDARIERTVFVRAPRTVRYGEVARAIDAVKGAGAQPIGLQTEALEN